MNNIIPTPTAKQNIVSIFVSVAMAESVLVEGKSVEELEVRSHVPSARSTTLSLRFSPVFTR